MPVEIRELIIKAQVENKAPVQSDNRSIELQRTNAELLLRQLNQKIKNRNER
ncbi:DUF5908 family protein [Larkinella rosea]|uniref:DUF5908 family protein n=1 Tax=Larkinella rosea TaxID=2025312 RepID=UPI001639B872|nr:DUF5908 family protein [Larkinella rosea]